MAQARPLVLGHRGDPRGARENTIDAFQQALAAGADGIEFDVRRGPQALVVHHDAALRRRGKRVPLPNLVPDELPAWMPRLDEVVAWAGPRDCLLDVEIKEAGIEEETLRTTRPLRSRCVYTSFLPDVVHRLRELDPEARVGWITKARPESVLLLAGQLGPPLVVLPARRCQRGLVDSLRAMSCEVWAWGVNAPGVADRMVALGVSGLITDAPRALVAWRGRPARPRKGPRKGRRGS